MKVALKSANGAYVSAVNGGDDAGLVRCTSTTIGPNETWELSHVPGGVTFQSSGGRHLSAEGGGGGAVHANRLKAEGWETFTPINGGFQCFDRVHWLTADLSVPDVPLVANRITQAAWEIFEMVPTEKAPHLEIRGTDFVDEHGERMVLCGADAFLAYRQELDDDPVLDPFLDELQALKFNALRVFFEGSKAQNTLFDLRPTEPKFYERVRPFADKVNGRGFVLLATIFVDNQDVKAGLDHWQRMADLLRGSATILSGGNQWSKNGFAPGNLTDPGMIWSRGSDIEDKKTFPAGASIQEFHPRRDLPASLMDAVASPINIYSFNRVPLIISEPIKFGETHDGDIQAAPFLSWQLARIYATMCAGAVFHNWFGQRGLLMGPNTRVCAEAWQRGMKL